MTRRRASTLMIVAVAVAVALSVSTSTQTLSPLARFWGSRYSQSATATTLTTETRPGVQDPRGRLVHWSHVAIDTSGIDHTPPSGQRLTAGEQLGPTRASRAMAIVHIAMFDVMNALMPFYQSYTGITSQRGMASADAAIAQAAHDTLVALFPAQATHCDELLSNDLGTIPDSQAKTNGVDLGKREAAAILALRADDGSNRAEPVVGTDFLTGILPGQWRQDPISQIPIALGAYWGQVKPFAMPAVADFRVSPPPALDSAEYAAAYDEVKRLGGDGLTTPTERTADETFTGIYWAYDGTPSLCAPPRMYNQIVTTIADQMGTNALDLARLLALANVAMADTAIAVWESKFYYNFWRPITGIRESDPGTGPTGLGDGNPATIGDPAFTPLGAPASNLAGPNFTPPFPSYPSGHAGFGGAVFQVLRQFYGTDDIAFTFVSDELNGVTVDNLGNVRPLLPRSFSSLSQAEDENGQSRIYLGIHWAFDKTAGIAQGRNVATYVFQHLFTRVR